MISHATILARLLRGDPAWAVDTAALPEPLAIVAREVLEAKHNRLDVFRRAALAHGLDAEQWIVAACRAAPEAPTEDGRRRTADEGRRTKDEGRQTADGGQPLSLLTSDALLSTPWPEPIWAVPRLLPVGLTILAGVPKLGKSWLALQLAQAVASGTGALGEQVVRGPVLYLALEDPPRRLRQRMLIQRWPAGLPAEFLTLGEFGPQVGDLGRGGSDRLASQIALRQYRLVVIDTFSRAFHGDQNDADAMTRALSPLQEMAHAQNCAVLVIDHHKKGSAGAGNPIADILGSTAKGATPDTIWSLYREWGKPTATLVITGRDVEERSLALARDAAAGLWHYQGEASVVALTERQIEIAEALRQLGQATCAQIGEVTGQDKGNVHRRLMELLSRGEVKREGRRYSLL